MSFKHVSTLSVSWMRAGHDVAVGRLAMNNHQVLFEYDPSFVALGIELSPFKLPLQQGVQRCSDRMFEGLFGLFNDSLPDGWGRLLLDRQLMQQGVIPGDLTPLDRLAHVGQHGMGALRYAPALGADISSRLTALDEMAAEALRFQEKEDLRCVEDLLVLNGSSAGARPKVLVPIDGEDWLVKLPSSLDLKDSGAMEYAYHQIAKDAGLVVPEARLFPAIKGAGYFGVKRFDRDEGQRIHVHTLSGLLHVDHRMPSVDYTSILKATAMLTQDHACVVKQFRAAVFNVLAHNRDDHAKNFSFLMDVNGVWQVSPAYDLTFSSGPGGEHCTMVCGEGKRPTKAHMLRLAQSVEIADQDASCIIEEVRAAVERWSVHADHAAVSQRTREMIQNALSDVSRDF